MAKIEITNSEFKDLEELAVELDEQGGSPTTEDLSYEEGVINTMDYLTGEGEHPFQEHLDELD